MSRNADIRDCTGGFAVLEALVALVLLVLTVGLVSALLGFGQHVAARAEARDAVAHMKIGSDALSTWLASASPWRPVRHAVSGPTLFEGRPDRLAFASTSTGDVAQPSLQAVTVGFGGHMAGRRGTILFDNVPLGLDISVLPDRVAATPLFGDVVSARFSYFGATKPGEAPVWGDGWTSAATLPRLVALDAEIATGTRVEMFHLMFRVRSE